MARLHNDTTRRTNFGIPRVFLGDIEITSYITDIIYSGDSINNTIRLNVHPSAPVQFINKLSGITVTNGPVPMRLYCPECGKLHVDIDEWATRPHHTHACQECGNVWRPAVVDTVGVKFLPGFHA